MTDGQNLVIHLISDVHIGPLHYEASDKTAFIRHKKGIQSRNVGAYLGYLEGLEDKSLPDLVVCSGDLTSYSAEDEMNEAGDMLDRIAKRLKKRSSFWRKSVKAPYVLIVPGNHDLDWSKSDFEQKIERYARMADALSATGDVVSSHYKNGDGPQYCDLGDEVNVFFYLLDTVSLGGIRDPVLDHIYNEIEESHQKLSGQKTDNFTTALRQFEAQIRKDPGYIDPQALDRMKQIISQEKISENRIKIAIMHHNPTSVPSDDIEAFDAIINAGIVKGMLADAGFDLILHGHRHVTNCTHERTLQRGEASQQGLFVVGTDSLGCNRNAPFLELSLWDTRTAHSSFPPALFSIRVAEFDGKRYKVEPEPFVEEAIHRPMSTAFGEMLRRLGRQVDQNRRASVLDHLRTILPHLQKLQTTLVDWGTESELWISKFHTQLSMYSKLWATDVQDRDSGIAPMFESYLREQYQARLSTRIKDRVLRYSGSTFGAIMKTGWRPDPLFWGDYTIEQRTSEETSELEIVRIIVRDRKGAERNYELEGLNFVHKFFAIPLFVINHKDLKDDEIEDFALGFDRTNRVLRSFEYDKALGKVVETDLDRGQQLEGRFRRLLAHQKLQTVDEFLNRGVMISDPRREREFAENYDKTRCASPMILQILGNALQPDASKAGLDVGCGTGNYTLPFVDKFGTVSGIDNSQAMLDVAKTKNKSDRVHWVHASILNSGFNDQSFDAVWSISALHYFKDSQLKYLLRQVFRLLRNGGVFVADTEFSEQQASLWLVKFFPSLHQRYANTCYPSQWFKDELRNAGFREVTLEHREYSSVEGDRFLRVGQHNPEIYLDHDVRAGIPAFVSMAAAERENGLARLRQAIRNGDIKQIINDYTEAATMPGDLGIIIARK